MGNDYRIFVANVTREKNLKELTNKDLGEMTGYKKQTIDAFMNGAQRSQNVAIAISKALDIPL